MSQLILALYHALADILRAAWEIVTRRTHSRYRATAVVRAPRDDVWRLLERHDITYAVNGMRVVVEPIGEVEHLHRARITLGGREVMAIGFQYVEVTAPSRMVLRYVPEHSSAPHTIGGSDTVAYDLEAVADGTRVTCTRDLEHRRASTRISAPVGVRQAVMLTRTQVEHEAGIAPATVKLWHQIGWAALAFASFAWLLDWRAAIALMVIIAVHEGGHALAMWWFGLGVSVVSFVPFLGGVAAPRRPYQTEVQRVVVALMGVAVSLPVSLAAIWLAGHYNLPNLGIVAVLAIVINGVNLVPFPALDGSVVVSILLSKLHKVLNLAVTILMFGLFVALGIILRDPLLWFAIAISFISVVQVMSLKTDEHLARMGRGATGLTLIAFLALLAAHAWAFHWASLTTARAEANAFSACVAATDRSQDAVRGCREQTRLWILDRD